MSLRSFVFVVGTLCVLSARADAKDWELVRVQGMMQLVYIEKSKERSRETYDDAIRDLCSPGKHCFLHFWSERRFVPASLPMTEAQSNEEVASFTRNPKSGREQFLWNCRIHNDPKQCFK